MIQVHKIPFDRVEAISLKDLFYINLDKRLEPFYAYTPDLSGLIQALTERKKIKTNRKLLVEKLKADYEPVETQPVVEQNISKLAEDNSFTIVTAHQPSLFTGPLYYVYKILSVIQLCKQLKKEKPEYDFIPCLVSGNEDHDFEEIKSFKFYNHNLSWESGQKGAVGRMHLSGLLEVIQEFDNLSGDKNKGLPNILKRFLEESNSYAEFQRHLVNHFFGKFGLVYIDLDNPDLKREFIPILKKELFSNESRSLVQETQIELEKIGFSSQSYAREINLFYLNIGIRERIIIDGDHFKILNTDLTFSKEEMEAELEAHPERFSPNVVLRPLYQEFTLPNIAYVGGGGEIAYWLERKSQFHHFGVFYPTLIRRNSALILSSSIQNSMRKLQLSIDDIFNDENTITKKLIEQQFKIESFESEYKEIKTIYSKIFNRMKAVDATLEGFVKSEEVKAEKAIQNIEFKYQKALKAKTDIKINQLKNILQKVFPSKGLQERNDNILQYIIDYEGDLIEELNQHFNPLDKEFLVFSL